MVVYPQKICMGGEEIRSELKMRIDKALDVHDFPARVGSDLQTKTSSAMVHKCCTDVEQIELLAKSLDVGIIRAFYP